MSYGFFAKGNAANLIIDDQNPVLAQLYRGDIYVNEPYADRTPWYGGRYILGSCLVSYPSPITTAEPPLVFAVPRAAAYSGGSIGFFAHLGGPGGWTGFRVLYVRMPFHPDYTYAPGTFSGWEYRACTFKLPPSNAAYGMRVWDANERLVFDSGWPIVPLRELLRDWRLDSAVKTGIYEYNAYYGNFDRNVNRQCDGTYQIYSHAWGAADGDKGVLISQLRAMTYYGDDGFSDYAEKVTAPVVGFLSGDRSRISCGLYLGILQHAGASIAPLNNFGLMTADFSKT